MFVKIELKTQRIATAIMMDLNAPSWVDIKIRFITKKRDGAAITWALATCIIDLEFPTDIITNWLFGNIGDGQSIMISINGDQVEYNKDRIIQIIDNAKNDTT